MDIANLMQMANQLRDRLSNASGEADRLRASGEAGGGLVRVVMNGLHHVLELKIDAKAASGMSADDRKLLEDLLTAAVNQAVANVGSSLKSHLGGLAKDFGVDLSALDGMMKPK